jgi:hypothetical protein
LNFKTFGIQNVKPSTEPTKAPDVINHIIVVDCSGSMSGDLPEIRSALKVKILSMVRPDDTLSIIWFSSRGLYGTLLSGFELANLKNLKTAHDAIDRFLKPIGMTGFKEPLEEALKIVPELNQKNGGVASLFFMSDGYENQWQPHEVLTAVKNLGPELASATFVEYGWNANHDLLAKMAESAGGELIFAEGFDAYEADLEQQMTAPKSFGGKKILLDTPNAVFDFAFKVDGSSILTYSITDGKVMVPEGIGQVSYFATTGEATEESAFAALYALSQRGKSEQVFEILGALGDVRLFQKFVNSFSKQDYINFQDAVMEALVDPTKRFLDGKSDNLIPAEDAYCVLNLLEDLSEDGNLVYPLHESFQYKRIGAKREQRDSVVTPEEEQPFLDAIKVAKSIEEKKAANDAYNAFLDSKTQLKFVFKDKNAGFPINGLVLSSERPNVSARFLFEGSIELPKHAFPKLGTSINTKIWRNFTIIRDGILNTKEMPVSLTAETFAKLQTNGLLAGEVYEAGKLYSLSFGHLPVMNRKMVKLGSSTKYFEKVWKLEQLKADAKVFNTFYTEKFERQNEGLKFLYGDEAAVWLKSLGIEDKAFQPRTVKGDTTDEYYAKIIQDSPAGLSNGPAKVSDLMAKLAANKNLTISEWIMLSAYNRYQDFVKSEFFVKAADQDAILRVWLETERKNLLQQTRELEHDLNTQRFSIVVGKARFSDFDIDAEDSAWTKEVGFTKPVSISIKLKDKIEKI